MNSITNSHNGRSVTGPTGMFTGTVLNSEVRIITGYVRSVVAIPPRTPVVQRLLAKREMNEKLDAYFDKRRKTVKRKSRMFMTDKEIHNILEDYSELQFDQLPNWLREEIETRRLVLGPSRHPSKSEIEETNTSWELDRSKPISIHEMARRLNVSLPNTEEYGDHDKRIRVQYSSLRVTTVSEHD